MPILIPGLHSWILVLRKDTPGRFRGDETTSSSQRIHRKTNDNGHREKSEQWSKWSKMLNIGVSS